mmetsp:Transcript_3522/g.5485  ORF Transcript_3522/g.5485 Transcript_3522/m.5485 type:complete len:105 (+) Transcript_3522:375-689(+)
MRIEPIIDRDIGPLRSQGLVIRPRWNVVVHLVPPKRRNKQDVPWREVAAHEAIALHDVSELGEAIEVRGEDVVDGGKVSDRLAVLLEAIPPGAVAHIGPLGEHS